MGLIEEFYYAYGLHSFQEGAVCLRHTPLDRERCSRNGSSVYNGIEGK